MFHIKICGVTRVGDAQAILDAGADAIGINFWPGSKRHVEIDIAREIASLVGGRMLRVGVFVNQSTAMIRRIFAEIPLDAVQLHGDEPVADLIELAAVPVIRAFRVGDLGLAALQSDLTEAKHLQALPGMVLIDAHQPGAYGGTGATANWSAVTQYLQWAANERFPLPALAGGLTPQNVAAAIAATGVQSVDTASGVESAPGMKDPQLIHDFVSAARSALHHLGWDGASGPQVAPGG
jgi:phosphoribosylanthranilate isomerase